jgi:hypothetical protein
LQKQSEDHEEILSVWLEHVAKLNGTEYDLTDLSDACLGALFLCIMCTDDSNIHDMSNWSPAFLRKVRKHVWEVFYEGLANVIEELEWDSDEGLKNLWGMYYMFPQSKLTSKKGRSGGWSS